MASSMRAHDRRYDDARRLLAREVALVELRLLVAAVESARERAPVAIWWTPLIGWLVLWSTPAACIVTLTPAIFWGRGAAFAMAGIETMGALIVRSRHLERSWWRRWLYGAGTGLMLTMIS